MGPPTACRRRPRATRRGRRNRPGPRTRQRLGDVLPGRGLGIGIQPGEHLVQGAERLPLEAARTPPPTPAARGPQACGRRRRRIPLPQLAARTSGVPRLNGPGWPGTGGGSFAARPDEGHRQGEEPVRLRGGVDHRPEAAARAEWVAGQYKEILGVDIKLAPTEGTALTALRKDPATFPQMLLVGGWIQDYPDPQNWLSVYWTCDADFAQRFPIAMRSWTRSSPKLTPRLTGQAARAVSAGRPDAGRRYSRTLPLQRSTRCHWSIRM